MPLETATYISDLVASNPASSDPLSYADSHMRLIKSAVKATFPSVTGAVTATHTQLNGAAGIFTSGSGVLADAGAFFKTNATDGFLNTLAGDIDIQLQGNLAFTFQRTAGVNTFKANGGITATSEIKGPGITPIGASVLWFDDVLPTDGLWAWANGGIIANANVVAPVLLARWGTRFGGNGTTTLGMPDLRDSVPVGKSTMGGAAARGLISAWSNTVVNSVIGLAATILQVANLPAYTPAGTVTNGAITTTAVNNPLGGSTGVGVGTGGLSGAVNVGTMTMTSTQAASSFTGTPQGGTSTGFNNVQPSTTVNFIIRIG